MRRHFAFTTTDKPTHKFLRHVQEALRPNILEGTKRGCDICSHKPHGGCYYPRIRQSLDGYKMYTPNEMKL
jgi:hypothetical protein